MTVSLNNQFAALTDLIDMDDGCDFAPCEIIAARRDARSPFRRSRYRIFPLHREWNDLALLRQFMDTPEDQIDNLLDLYSEDVSHDPIPRAQRVWIPLAKRKKIIRDALMLAQVAEPQFCCKKKCFKLTMDQVDGPACKVCKNFSFCCCECATYKNRQERNERKREAESRKQFLALKKEKTQLLRILEKNKNYRKKISCALQAKMKAQIGENLFKIPESINTCLNTATDSLNAVSLATVGSLDSVNGLINTVKEMIDKFASYFNAPKGMDTFAFALNVISFLKSLYYKEKLGMAISMMALARNLDVDFSVWGERIMTCLKSLTPSMIIPANFSWSAQADFGFLTALPVVNIIGTVALTLMSMLSGASSFNYSSLLKHVGEFGRAAIGFTKLGELFMWLKDTCLDMYYRTKGTTLAKVKLQEAYPALATVLTKCEVLRSPEFSMTFLDNDKRLCQEITALETKLIDLKMDAIRARENCVVNQIQTQLSSLSEVFRIAKTSSVHNMAVRDAPFTCWIFGAPKCGKSTFVTFLKAAIYEKYYKDDPQWTLDTLTHTRCAENEFWDGILPDQPVVQYDDMLQTTDSKTTPNPEVLELIRIKNEAVYQLHMSDVRDKKSYYFNSKYVVATSNSKRPAIVSIKEPKAFYRRWDIAVEVKPNPAYATTVKSSSGDGDYQCLDDSKVDARRFSTEEAFLKEVYCFDIYDMNTNTTLWAGLDFDSFLDYFFKTAKDVQKESSDLNDSILRQLGLNTQKDTKNHDSFMKKFMGQSDDPDSNPDGDEQFVDAEQMHMPEDDTDFYSETPRAVFWTTYMQILHCQHGPDTTCSNCENFSQFYETEEFKLYVQVVSRSELAKVISAQLERDEKIAVDWIDEALRDNACNDNRLTIVKVIIEKWLLFKKTPPVSALRRLRNRIAQHTWTSLILTPLDWLMRFVCSKQFGTIVSIACIGLPLLGLSLSMLNEFVFIRCKRTLARPTALANVECSCVRCENFTSTAALGSPTYHRDSLLYMLINHDQFFLNEAHIKEFHRVDILAKEEDAVRVATSTRKLHDAIFAESKETMTRGVAPRRFAESKETMTRGAPTRKFAEMLTPAPVYTSVNNELSLKAQAHELVQLEQWESVTVKNAVRLTIPETEANLAAHFVCGRTLLMPNHFLHLVRKTRDKVFVMAALNQPAVQRVELDACTVQQCTDAFGGLVDLALVGIPNTISRPSIISKICTANQLAHINEGTVVLSGVRNFNNISSVFTYHADKVTLLGSEQSYPTADGIPHRIHMGILYELDTKAGDCGALLYAKNPLLPAKIVGMHVAGHKGDGMSIPLTREFLERNLTRYNYHAVPRLSVNGKIPFAQAEIHQPKYEDILPSNTLTKIGNCLSLGLLTMPNVPKRSKISPSLVSGVLQEPVCKPAYLTPVTLPTGEKIDPMAKGIKKVLNVNQPIEKYYLDVSVADVESTLFNAGFDSKHTPYVLTYEEAVEGIPGDELLPPLNRTTSPGYPYSLVNDAPGKRKWFGFDTYEYSPEIKQDCDDLIKAAMNNERGDVVWMATLKDERRPIAKVDQGKTRVFAACPMHYAIVFRQYFLSFFAWIMENKIVNEIGVGTNVYSLDWHKTALALKEHGPHVIAGDFSNFDGSLRQDVLWEILDMINRWYDDGKTNAQIRSVLFEEICNARVLVNGELINWDHSQPSGNPGTVIFNSIFNQIVMRIAYLKCKEKAGLDLYCDFKDYVSMQTYGDDNVLNISPEVIEWYNQITITDALAEIGLTYTDEAKTGELVQARTLDTIAYLKRSFVQDANGYYRAPLDLTVCKEMPNWIRGNAKKEATVENVAASLMEFYFHGKEKFDDARAKLNAALLQAGCPTKLPTYVEVESLYATKYF